VTDSAAAAGWVTAVATIGIAVVGWARANRDAREAKIQAERAHSASQQSADAADRTAAALERVSDLFEESLSMAEKRDQRQWSPSRSTARPPRGMGFETRGGGPWAGPPVAGPPDPVVHWTVDKVKGGLHTLTNLGRATAYDVTLSCENAVRFDGPDEPQTVEMGQSVQFCAFGSWQTGISELVVTWRDAPDGEVQRWTRLLP
jgi:hypothetical protein